MFDRPSSGVAELKCSPALPSASGGRLSCNQRRGTPRRSFHTIRWLESGRKLRRLVEPLAADQHAADFGGAGADLVELCVTQQTTGGIVVDVAVAAEQLDR